ncbi:MAG: AmpG family muropeptide MFS transporter [Desulfosalsimonadaceae bacterium]|nr:AmpG family muropeptide MFS transporter [Desulfosalsimonadaceae bacterium]
MKTLRIIFSARMLVALLMGFSCGVPLNLTITVLQAWMKVEGVDLSVIGLMALVGLPYTLKFVGAPVLDRYVIPVFGRRRGWLIISQTLLMLSIIGLGTADPAGHPGILAFAALLVTFFSASQDIVTDAYRREDIPDTELGFASSLYINGYRLAMLLAGGGGLILADHMPFSMVYLLMACCLVPGILTTLFAPEPEIVGTPPASMRAAVLEPLMEYFQRDGAVWILAFILMYKIGDAMASAMTMPFYLDMGFSPSEIGVVVKIFGFWATIAGALIGGVMTLKIGMYASLWVFGVFQALSTACFALLVQAGQSIPALACVIGFENLTSGMGTVAFVAFMAMMTDRRFTATQYALLSSLMGIPRVIASAPTGYAVKLLGWEPFFIVCALMAIPGLLILLKSSVFSDRTEATTKKD